MKEKVFDQTLRDRLLSHDSAPADHVWDKINAKVKSLENTDDNFDQSVEGKLQPHESEVPDRVWENIQRDLERRKPRLIIPYMIAGLALLAILATIWWNVVRNDMTELSADQQQIDGTEYNSDRHTTNQNEKGLNESNKLSISGDLVQSNDQTSNYTLNSNDQNESSSSNQVNQAGESKLVNVAGESKQDISQSNSNQRVNTSTSDAIVGDDEKILGNQTNSFSNKNKITHLELSTRTSGVNQQNESGLNIIKRTGDQSTFIGVEAQSNVKKELSAQAQIDNGQIAQERLIENENNLGLNNGQNLQSNLGAEIERVDSKTYSTDIERNILKEQHMTSSSKAISLLTRDEESQGKNKLFPLGNGSAKDGGMFMYDPCSVKGGKKKNRVHCFSFVKKSEITFADFSIGAQYSNKILKSRLGPAEQNNLLTDRENTESYMFSYNAQARVGIKTNSGLTGTIGLSYDRYNERFEFFDPNERRIIIRINGIGDTTEVIVEAFGERTVKHTNTLTFVSIPFTAGYMWQTDKFNIGVHGGLALNLLFFKGGRIVAGDGSVTTLNGEAKKDVYKPSAGFSALGGLVFEYKIRDNLSFVVEPNIKYNLRSLTTDGYTIDQKYITTGINVGLRTIINKKITQKKKYGSN